MTEAFDIHPGLAVILVIVAVMFVLSVVNGGQRDE